MGMLLVGFDSAWTRRNKGGLVAVMRENTGAYRELGAPLCADFDEAQKQIDCWRCQELPTTTVVMLDQPTIVENATGQRKVESLASSPVSFYKGGTQPSNTSKVEMFGASAPVWEFLDAFGGAADPMKPAGPILVFETYPVLALISMRQLVRIGDTESLPKYNPANRKKFVIEHWQALCVWLADEFKAAGLVELRSWLLSAAANAMPRKLDQDKLDACICLLVACHYAEQKPLLMVGCSGCGYILVPHGHELENRLIQRAEAIALPVAKWVRRIEAAANLAPTAIL